MINSSSNAELRDARIAQYLKLGDSALILGQRLSEWCGHSPTEELDVSLTNIALDSIGQAQILLEFAAQLMDATVSADDLAFGRDMMEYRNLLIVEQPNLDFAQTIARQFLFSTYQLACYRSLSESAQAHKDPDLAGFAEKCTHEVQYHVKFSSAWMYRLGDGTQESRTRLQRAVQRLMYFTGEFFESRDTDEVLFQTGLGIDYPSMKQIWLNEITNVIEGSTLVMPEQPHTISGHQQGEHTEHLGHLLADMQFLHRSYPGFNW